MHVHTYMCAFMYVCGKWCDILKYTQIVKRVKLIGQANIVPVYHSFEIIPAPLLSGYLAFPSLFFTYEVLQSSHVSLNETHSDNCILRQVSHCASQTAATSPGDVISWDHHCICDLTMIKMSLCGLQLCVSVRVRARAFFIDCTTSYFQLVVKETSY